MNKLFLLLFFLIFHLSIAFAIDVGGHITEDTVWSPENNPYNVTENLFIDENVTLRILPGTEVKIGAAPCRNYQELSDNFIRDIYDYSVAKFIWVDGRIIAEGTDENMIYFSRIQNESEYFWGTIYITEQAEMCRFQYCKFEYSQQIIIAVGNIANGTIVFDNRTGLFRNNIFLNCPDGIHSQRLDNQLEVEITDNTFKYTEDLNQYGFSHSPRSSIVSHESINSTLQPLICNNQTDNSMSLSINSVFAYNKIKNYYIGLQNFDATNIQSSYIYKNEFENNNTGIDIYGNSNTSEIIESIYVKENRFLGRTDGLEAVGLEADYVYLEVSNNYFEGCEIYTGLHSQGEVFNNIINSGNVRAFAYVDFFNNIGFNGETGITITYRNQASYNNISINNQYAFNGVYYDYYNNCIFLNNENISQNGVSGNPVFRNCILDFELPEECIDGGGNIWVTPEEAEQIFVDIENGDFHLTEGSIAIDAGFDTLGYYYPFDPDYSQRVWDGNGDGNAIIDIGAYEYGAPHLGKINGYITETTTGEPVKYVLIKPNNESSDFVVADSTGYFELQLPEGNYDLYCQRVFYESTIEYNVSVQNEQTTEIAFTMTDILPPLPPVGNEGNSVNQVQQVKLSNYPNPFNPETTISYSLTGKISNPKIEIFNIKGQIVKSFKLQNQAGKLIWSGKNDAEKNVSSGLYFYHIKNDNYISETKKMILIK